MAQVTWIIVGILAVSCSAQFGFNRNERFEQRPQLFPFNNRQTTPFKEQTNRILQSFGINPDDHKCFTLARRPFYMTRIVHYPCSRRMPGVPVIKSFLGKCKRHRSPMGPICMSYIREPVYRYYKIPLCCPGYTMDLAGKCSIRKNNRMRNMMRPQSMAPHDRMMSMAAKMRQAMFIRAKKDMARRRAMFLMSMSAVGNNRRQGMMPPRLRSRRPSLVPLYFMYKMHQNMMKRRQQQQQQQSPRVAFLRFNKPNSPPMPHPVQQPPLSGRFVNLIRSRFNPRSPFPFMLRPTLPAPPIYNLMKPARPPMIPRIVLSSRTTILPFNRMAAEFHPRMPDVPDMPRMERPPYQDMPPQEDNFPMIPDSPQHEPMDAMSPMDQAADGFQGDLGQEFAQYPLNDGFQGPQAQESQMPADTMMQVDLPAKPVEMPDLIVEQAPHNMVKQESCIVRLEAAVKTCLTQNNIDVPDVMSAFEPFNDDKSRVLCEAEDAIFKCISASLNECGAAHDAEVARDMLLETAQTVRSMCELRSASVVHVEQVDNTRTSPSQSDLTLQGADTVATVENVDAIPTDVKIPPTPEKEIAVIEDKPIAAPSVESVKEAIQHEVHVQEMRMKEYLLPILLGAGVGFILLVLCASLLICCCCRRKLKKKMAMAKELEKPEIKDAIYTIGLPPPTYEVKGIPPMYYEEAKGETITSRRPSVASSNEDTKE